jgi:adenine-specific DNA-methyltransferase
MTRSPLVSLPDWLAETNAKYGIHIAPEDVDSLVDLYLIPKYASRSSDSEPLYLRDDLNAWLGVFKVPNFSVSDFANPGMFDRGALRRLRLSEHTHVEFADAGQLSAPLRPLIRHLARQATADSDAESGQLQIPFYPAPELEIPFHAVLADVVHLSSTSAEVLTLARDAHARIRSLEKRDNDFARTANYMGSKRGLRAFLVEGVDPFIPPDGAVLDLMCGSGAAAAAFSTHWLTFASDAQAFCRTLAQVQGSGFTQLRASQLLEKITPVAREHAAVLGKRLETFLSIEDEVLFRDADTGAFSAFQRLACLPTYPGGGLADGWDPNSEVEARKLNPSMYPYCLFTAYFANVYFGIRQSIDIDSIRYAIDQLDDSERTWALGALIATASAVGTTYAAHFAQPRLPPGKQVKLRDFSEVQEQRSRSVLHEFSIRLLALGQQSEESNRPITAVEGPWRVALDSVRTLREKEPVLVYVDAPYTREEYSRYYHVLETLVSYRYPSSVGIGRTPEKGIGPAMRFQSEFFTKNETRVVDRLVDVICGILGNGWTCAWSYASNGLASIPTVVETVARRCGCAIHSFATPYVHNAQGRQASSKRVVEYLVIFVPDRGN